MLTTHISDSLVLDGLLIVNHPLLVEDSVPTIDTLHGIVGSQSELLPALYIDTHVLPQT